MAIMTTTAIALFVRCASTRVHNNCRVNVYKIKRIGENHTHHSVRGSGLDPVLYLSRQLRPCIALVKASCRSYMVLFTVLMTEAIVHEDSNKTIAFCRTWSLSRAICLINSRKYDLHVTIVGSVFTVHV